jgi:protein AFG1
MMTWGKKAGPWGKGVEGLDERTKEDINEEARREDEEKKKKKKGE